MNEAIAQLDQAIAHRARIGAELNPKSSPVLVRWYEDALDAEKLARQALGAELDAGKQNQLRAACAI